MPGRSPASSPRSTGRRARPDCSLVASFATDAPFLPRDLVARLAEARANAGAALACAASDGRAHPVFGLWPVALRDDLRAALVERGERKIDRWTARHALVEVPFRSDPVDPFFNANRTDDLAEAERLIAEYGPGPLTPRRGPPLLLRVGVS